MSEKEILEQILKLRQEGLSLRETGERLGLSHEQVRQYEKQARGRGSGKRGGQLSGGDTVYKQLYENREDVTTTERPSASGRRGKMWPIIRASTSEEIEYKRTIRIDAASLKAAFCLDDFRSPGEINPALAARFGMCFMAILVGCQDHLVREETRRVLELLQDESDEARGTINIDEAGAVSIHLAP